MFTSIIRTSKWPEKNNMRCCRELLSHYGLQEQLLATTVSLQTDSTRLWNSTGGMKHRSSKQHFLISYFDDGLWLTRLAKLWSYQHIYMEVNSLLCFSLLTFWLINENSVSVEVKTVFFSSPLWCVQVQSDIQHKNVSRVKEFASCFSKLWENPIMDKHDQGVSWSWTDSCVRQIMWPHKTPTWLARAEAACVCLKERQSSGL